MDVLLAMFGRRRALVRRVGRWSLTGNQYLVTVTGIVSAIVFLGESLEANQPLGAEAIFCGVCLGRRQ